MSERKNEIERQRQTDTDTDTDRQTEKNITVNLHKSALENVLDNKNRFLLISKKIH